MSNKHALIAVAHPDDEAIYFWGIIHALIRLDIAVHVVTAVTRFTDSESESIRKNELAHSVEGLCVTHEGFGMQDVAGSLDTDALEAKMNAMVANHHFDVVYTHGIWGEYGHPHHRDVSWVTHRVFLSVLSIAGPFPALDTIRLSCREFETKQRFIRHTYPSQSHAWRLATRDECFSQLTMIQVDFFRCIAMKNIHIAANMLKKDRMLKGLAEQCLIQFDSHGPPSSELRVLPSRMWRSQYKTYRNSLLEALNLSIS